VSVNCTVPYINGALFTGVLRTEKCMYKLACVVKLLKPRFNRSGKLERRNVCFTH